MVSTCANPVLIDSGIRLASRGSKRPSRATLYTTPSLDFEHPNSRRLYSKRELSVSILYCSLRRNGTGAASAPKSVRRFGMAKGNGGRLRRIPTNGRRRRSPRPIRREEGTSSPRRRIIPVADQGSGSSRGPERELLSEVRLREMKRRTALEMLLAGVLAGSAYYLFFYIPKHAKAGEPVLALLDYVLTYAPIEKANEPAYILPDSLEVWNTPALIRRK